MLTQTLQAWGLSLGKPPAFYSVFGLAVPEPQALVGLQGRRRACAALGVGPCGRMVSGPLSDSLVLRPWIQDIEGANTMDLCNASSPGSRSSVLTGKSPCEGVELRWGPGLLRRPCRGRYKCLSSRPRPRLRVPSGTSWHKEYSPERGGASLGLLGMLVPPLPGASSVRRREAV